MTLEVKFGFSFKEAEAATSLGPTTLYQLVKEGVIRTSHVGTRTILNAEDVRRVAVEGHKGQQRTPPVRHGDEHHRSRRRRMGGGEPPAAA